jgi:hypothetical protein
MKGLPFLYAVTLSFQACLRRANLFVDLDSGHDHRPRSVTESGTWYKRSGKDVRLAHSRRLP